MAGLKNATEINKGLFMEKDKAKLEEVVPVQAEEKAVVSVKMSKAERDAFKMFCLQKGLKLTEAVGDAMREYMQNHK